MCAPTGDAAAVRFGSIPALQRRRRVNSFVDMKARHFSGKRTSIQSLHPVHLHRLEGRSNLEWDVAQRTSISIISSPRSIRPNVFHQRAPRLDPDPFQDQRGQPEGKKNPATSVPFVRSLLDTCAESGRRSFNPAEQPRHLSGRRVHSATRWLQRTCQAAL